MSIYETSITNPKKQLEFYKQLSEHLQQENKQLKEKLDCDLQWAFKYEKQADNWNKLKEWVNKHYDYYMNNEDYIGGRLCFTDMKNKMQEIEKGNDSNE